MLRRKATLFTVLFSLAAALALLDAAPVSPSADASRALPASRQEADEDIEDTINEARDRAADILRRYNNVIFGVMIPLGLLLAVAGYRFLKPTVFVAGFFVGGFILSTIVYRLTNDSNAGAWAPIASFLVGGIAVGLCAVFLTNFGIFLAGAALGVTIAFALRTLFASISTVSSAWAFYLFVGVMAIAMGVLAVCLKKPVVIFATAFGGAFGFVYGIGRFTGDFPTPSEFLEADTEQLGWEVWVMFGAWLAVSIVGLIIQYKYTANKKKSKDHESFSGTLKHGVAAAPPANA